jgi:hypothetical protein
LCCDFSNVLRVDKLTGIVYLLKTMKNRALYFGLFLVLAMSVRASAQKTVTYDSIPIDSVFYATYPAYADSLEGSSDHQQVHIGGSDFYAVQFSDIEHQVVLMDSGAELDVYWSRVSSDSCAMDIQFQYYNYAGTPILGPTVHLIESGPENVWQKSIILVPRSGYNTLQISLGSSGNAGQPGADSCFFDAIVLIQSGLASVAQPAGMQRTVLMNYPNPFFHSSGTHVRVNAPYAGVGMLSVSDALGREIAQMPLGELNSGDQEASLSLERAGVYFVRLYIDGTPVGSPLEVSGE